MITSQNYDPSAVVQPPVEPTAQNDPQIADTNDGRQSQPSRYSVAQGFDLRLSAIRDNDRESEAELVYWALEASKHKYLADSNDDDKYHANQIQEIQNTLFQGICELASELHYQAKNKR